MICVLVFIKISNKGSFINHYVRISRTIWPPLHIIRTFFNMPEIEKALDTTHLTLHSSHSSCRAQCISLLFDFARYNKWDSKSRDSRPLVTSAVDYIHNTESIRIRTNLWCRFFSVNRPKGTSSLKWTRTHLSNYNWKVHNYFPGMCHQCDHIFFKNSTTKRQNCAKIVKK